MFAGIVEKQLKVLKTEKGSSGFKLSVEKPSEWNDLRVGESISLDGVCLTVERFDQATVDFFVGAETMQVTIFPRLLKTDSTDKSSSKTLNAERSLKLGDRIHGHMVSGHVDTVALVIESEKMGECLLLKLEVPAKYKNFTVLKGSVAINGTSLTVNEVQDDTFSVLLIPETLRQTNLSALKAGDQVNIEFDQMVKTIRAQLAELMKERSL